MDYPKFIPAGNSVNGFNPNEMIDLADIFDGKLETLLIVKLVANFYFHYLI